MAGDFNDIIGADDKKGRKKEWSLYFCLSGPLYTKWRWRCCPSKEGDGHGLITDWGKVSLRRDWLCVLGQQNGL